ncbi:hypothetical protein [Paenochrobactrum pullorum]|uniref:hypothetical protein n=1 Tax=Paenochrobactrum pullorum TaxID=1324351 RepID=UPI0035BC2519
MYDRAIILTAPIDALEVFLSKIFVKSKQAEDDKKYDLIPFLIDVNSALRGDKLNNRIDYKINFYDDEDEILKLKNELRLDYEHSFLIDIIVVNRARVNLKKSIDAPSSFRQFPQ